MRIVVNGQQAFGKSVLEALVERGSRARQYGRRGTRGGWWGWTSSWGQFLSGGELGTKLLVGVYYAYTDT